MRTLLQAVARKYEHDLPTLSASKDGVPDIFKPTSRSAKREMCRHTGRVQSFVGSRPTRLCFALCTVDGYCAAKSYCAKSCNAVAKHMFDKVQCGLILNGVYLPCWPFPTIEHCQGQKYIFVFIVFGRIVTLCILVFGMLLRMKHQQGQNGTLVNILNVA